jgi:hypothetical protein
MARMSWRPLRGVERSRLSAARLQAHYAVQWLARAARAYIPAGPDDSHTNLGWDDALDGFTGHPVKDGVRLGLSVARLELVVLGGPNRAAFGLNGQTNAAARRWCGEQMTALGLDAADLDAPAPYTIAAHAIATGAAYDAATYVEALAELASWFANANRTLEGTRAAMSGRGFAASAVRCWPHHFDIATLAALDARRSVNTGLSPGDEWYDEPYFYVSPYPYPDTATLPKLPPLGHWHMRGFTAAIAPASRILAAADRQAASEEFLRAAAEGAVRALT